MQSRPDDPGNLGTAVLRRQAGELIEAHIVAQHAILTHRLCVNLEDLCAADLRGQPNLQLHLESAQGENAAKSAS